MWTRRRTFGLALSAAVALLAAHAAETVYFPPGTQNWYPKHLAAMGEPSLFEQSTNQTIEQYRFLWLRTFHKPIAIRVCKGDERITLRVVRLSGMGGYDPGKIEHDETFTVTAEQWDGMLKLLAKASFWNTPAEDRASFGNDGSQWILEGQAHGKYHVIDRWTPDNDREKRKMDGFVACCRYFISLSKLQIPKDEDY